MDCIYFYSFQSTREDEHQSISLKWNLQRQSLLKDRENMRDPEPAERNTLKNKTGFRVMYFIAQHVHNGTLNRTGGLSMSRAGACILQHSQSKRTDVFSLSFGPSLSPLVVPNLNLICFIVMLLPAAPPNWASSMRLLHAKHYNVPLINVIKRIKLSRHEFLLLLVLSYGF